MPCWYPSIIDLAANAEEIGATDEHVAATVTVASALSRYSATGLSQVLRKEGCRASRVGAHRRTVLLTKPWDDTTLMS
jgi:hypothetical protein